MAPRKKKIGDLIVLIKGGGEMATGVAHRLARSGFRVGLTEIAGPLAVPIAFDKDQPFKNLGIRVVHENVAGKPAVDTASIEDIELTAQEESRARGRTEQFIPALLNSPVEPGALLDITIAAHDGRQLLAA